MRRILTAIFLLCGAFAQVCAASPDPHRLLLYNLLDLDQRDLFEGQDHSPLAELQAWENLYVELRDKAGVDASGDRRHIKSFLLIGWIAREKNHFATVEAFNIDLMHLFESHRDDTLHALAALDFALPTMCTYLAKFFFFENAVPEKRHAWLAANEGAMRRLLGAERTNTCREAFNAVSR
jgi:hypothetical protein